MSILPKSTILRYVLVLIAIVILTMAGALFWLSHNLTTVVEQTLRRTYGSDFAMGGIETGWNRVVLRDVSLRRPGGGPIGNRISIGRVIITPRFKALLTRRIEINLFRMENLRVLIEIAADGTTISPLSSRSNTAAGTSPSRIFIFPVAIRRIEVERGELNILDRSAERLKKPGVSNRNEGFHLIRFTNVELRTGPLEYPLNSAAVPVTFYLVAPGPGSLNVAGTFNPVTLDADLKVTLRHWDLTRFRPYYLKPDDLDVIRGYLDADATIAIAAKKLHAPGEIRISGLEVERTGSQGAFLGMSAGMFLSAMKDNKGEIRTTFLLDGDLNDPRFKVRQSLMEQIGNGLARKFGIPVISDVGSGIINLGKKGIWGLRNLFGRGK
jgi:hypothetical protein